MKQGDNIGFFAGFRKLGRTFTLLWIGELAYGLGGILLQFALGVWIFQTSGSTSQFAYSFLSASVPMMLLAPIAATLADRMDRRWVVLGVDIFIACAAGLLGFLLITHRFTVPLLYIFNIVGACAAAIRAPAYQAAVSSVLPSDILTRAAGLMDLGGGVLGLVGPLLAGALLARAGLVGVVATQLAAVVGGTLSVLSGVIRVRMPKRPKSEALGSLWRGLFSGLGPGLKFFSKQSEMLALAAYEVVHDGLLVLASAMLTPLILSSHTVGTLSVISSCSAAGAIVGSLFVVVVNTNSNLMSKLVGFNVILSVCVLVAGVVTSPLAWGICAFLALFASSAAGACTLALWMGNTPKTIQGSIFAVVGVVHMLVSSFVMLIGGIVADKVLEPALAPNGPWATTIIGEWMGTGKGRGIGFLFFAAGGVCSVVSILALVWPRLRQVGDPSSVSHDIVEI